MALISTAATLVGFSFGTYLLARYRLWKAGRREIPMELNPRTGVYEPDLTLRKWERRAKLALLIFYLMIPLMAYAIFEALPASSLPK